MGARALEVEKGGIESAEAFRLRHEPIFAHELKTG